MRTIKAIIGSLAAFFLTAIIIGIMNVQSWPDWLGTLFTIVAWIVSAIIVLFVLCLIEAKK